MRVNIDEPTTHLHQVKAGEVFLYQTKVYLRVRLDHAAVSLEEGTLIHLLPDTAVKLLKNVELVGQL